MGYCGATAIEELQRNTRFIRISTAGLREAHVHDVVVSKEAPNYQIER
jgi:IMP dehydrogenase